MNIRENINNCHLAETLAKDHIRFAITHIQSYLSTWWTQEHFDKNSKQLYKIINELNELIY